MLFNYCDKYIIILSQIFWTYRGFPVKTYIRYSWLWIESNKQVYETILWKLGLYESRKT